MIRRTSAPESRADRVDILADAVHEAHDAALANYVDESSLVPDGGEDDVGASLVMHVGVRVSFLTYLRMGFTLSSTAAVSRSTLS
jgi:hypothetical protein